MKLTRRRFAQALGTALVALTAPLPPSLPRVVREKLKVPSAYFQIVVTLDMFEDPEFDFELEVMDDVREFISRLDHRYLYVDAAAKAALGDSSTWSVRVSPYSSSSGVSSATPGADWSALEYRIRRPALEVPGARLRVERPSWWPA